MNLFYCLFQSDWLSLFRALTALVLSGGALRPLDCGFSGARATDFGDVPLAYDNPVQM